MSTLFDIIDPEAVNTLAFAEQNIMIEKLGGIEAICSMQSFNQTPIE